MKIFRLNDQRIVQFTLPTVAGQIRDISNGSTASNF
jgi:hypothetical protein